MKLVLVARVVTEDNKNKNSRKCPHITHAVIRLSDGTMVADGILGGKYNQNQALKEFYNDCRLPANKQRFKHHPGYDTAKLAKLVP